MKKYIDVCALMDNMRESFNERFKEEEPSNDFAKGFMMANCLIETAPCVDAVEVKRGKWLQHKYCGETYFTCPQCEMLVSPQWKCCPVCCMMVEKEEK